MKATITNGTKVMWSGAWNTQPEKEATIEGIYQGNFEGDKDGYEVDHVDWAMKNTCTFDLSNGHWCYGNQIHSIVE